MSFSIFPQTIDKDYVINFYRSHSFGKDKNLITTETGSWVLLDDKEFSYLRAKRVHEKPQLFNELKSKDIVITRESFEKTAENYRKRKSFLFKYPDLHIITPTLRCNLNCIYCHSNPKNPEIKKFDMDKDTAKSVVDFIINSPSKNPTIEFQGGECLLNFDTTKFIIEYAEKKAKEKNKKISFTLVTNMTLMNEEIISFLKNHHIVGIATSLDGPKEVHDKNRKYIKNNGSYDDVAYWIEKINKSFGKYFNLGGLCTITKNSLPYHKEIIEEYYKLGFRTVWPRVLNNLGFAHSVWKKIGYTPKEYIEFYKKFLNEIIEMNKYNKRIIEVYSMTFSQKILNREPVSNVDMISPCGAGIGQLLYDYKGDIFTCDEAKIFGEDFKIGNVNKNNIVEVLKHPTVASMMNISSKLPLICDKCVFSPYCAVCPIHFYVTQGNIVPKMANDFRCEIYKEIIKIIFKKILFEEKDREVFLDWFKFPPISRRKVLKSNDFI